MSQHEELMAINNSEAVRLRKGVVASSLGTAKQGEAMGRWIAAPLQETALQLAGSGFDHASELEVLEAAQHSVARLYRAIRAALQDINRKLDSRTECSPPAFTFGPCPSPQANGGVHVPHLTLTLTCTFCMGYIGPKEDPRGQA